MTKNKKEKKKKKKKEKWGFTKSINSYYNFGRANMFSRANAPYFAPVLIERHLVDVGLKEEVDTDLSGFSSTDKKAKKSDRNI